MTVVDGSASGRQLQGGLTIQLCMGVCVGACGCGCVWGGGELNMLAVAIHGIIIIHR